MNNSKIKRDIKSHQSILLGDAMMEQLTLAYDDTLTELNGRRGQIKRTKIKQRTLSSNSKLKLN